MRRPGSSVSPAREKCGSAAQGIFGNNPGFLKKPLRDAHRHFQEKNARLVVTDHCIYALLYQQTAGVLLMSPHPEPKKHPRDPQSHLGSSAGQDKERNTEGERHHPTNTPHAAHHPQAKPVLSPRHDAHTHHHGDELPNHTNQPSTIRPSKKMTQTGKS